MSNGIDEAASAFSKDIGGSQAPAEVKGNGPTDTIFSHLGDKVEGTAGGDEPADVEEKVGASAAEEAEETDEDGETPPEGEKEEDDDSEKYLVTVDGAEKEVSLREALDGYIRTETFHQRLNQLVEARQGISQRAQEVEQTHAQYVEKLEELESQLAALVPEEPNWDELFAKDPRNARDLQKQYTDYYQRRAAIEEERKRVAADQAKRSEAATQEYASAERAKFIAANPGWSDKKVMKSDLEAMRTVALEHGFSEDEISTVYDSRMLNVLLKASKYDRLQKSKPIPVNRGTRSVKPGAGAGNGVARRGLSQAQSRLSKTGSVEDAAAVFRTILER